MVFGFVKASLRAATGVKQLRVSKSFSVPIEDYIAIGERDAILASSGMGKSYLAGVLAEETLENGGLLCVIDPEGEYFTLAERYPLLVIGGERGMLPLSEAAIDLYVEMMLEANIPLVFDLSDYIDVEQQALYAHIADSLFNLETKYRKKVRLIIEEAQIYAPQRMAAGGSSKVKMKQDPVYVSQQLAKRGRKRAIDTLWATQRPASLSKDILSQCNRFWFGGITAEQDYKAIKPFLNEAGISFAQLKNLRPGEFFFYSKGQTQILRVRKRFCKHAGATPEAQRSFEAISNSQLEKAIAILGEQINRREADHNEEQSEIKKLKQYIRQLEAQMDVLHEELEQERTATKVLGRLGIRSDDAGSFGVDEKPKRRVRRISQPKGVNLDEPEDSLEFQAR
jgi:Helicase HerA, central domain